MIRNLILAPLIFLSLTSAQAAVTKTHEADCTKYSFKNEGNLSSDEEVILNKRVYGLYIDDMNIDFNNRQAKFDLRAAVIMGINRNVLRQQIKIKETHPRFKKFVNLLNKDLHLLEEICLNRSNEVVRFHVLGEEQEGETSN